jgi:hypothetical protein
MCGHRTRPRATKMLPDMVWLSYRGTLSLSVQSDSHGGMHSILTRTHAQAMQYTRCYHSATCKASNTPNKKVKPLPPPPINPATVLKAPTAKTGAKVCTAKHSAAHHSPPHTNTQLQLQHRTAQLAATAAAAAAVSEALDTRYTPAPLAASNRQLSDSKPRENFPTTHAAAAGCCNT